MARSDSDRVRSLLVVRKRIDAEPLAQLVRLRCAAGSSENRPGGRQWGQVCSTGRGLITPAGRLSLLAGAKAALLGGIKDDVERSYEAGGCPLCSPQHEAEAD